MMEGVTALHTTDGEVDGRQPVEGRSPSPSRSGETILLSSDGTPLGLSLREEIQEILFKPDSGDDEPSGL
ncbi:hypothetical protein HAX54_000973 [Datura stramonium]|uniref:Uncharacterized protein n=1 Tax=Datura stramonium TaxID=4076 RepID=A0ABS8T1R9_DATST|nr:hypothetical protein [Datura stramonium]